MLRTVETSAGRMTYELIRTVHLQAKAAALPGGLVRVYAPAGFSLRDADVLVQREASTLRARLRILDAPQCAHDCIPIEGIPHILRRECGRGVSCIENGVVCLAGNDLSTLLMPLAQQRIAQRLEYWHTRIGGEYAAVSVEDLGIKWGACDQAHNLSFSWRLILTPPEALDYVVIHELCHLHGFSHSARFWHMVQSHMPDYAVWKKWLAVHKSELMSIAP